MLDSCCLLGHVDFAFSYVFLGTHVSSCRSALEITKYYSHSTSTGVCIHWVCVYIAIEMPTINKHLHPGAFRKTKVFSHHRKVPHPKQGRAPASPLSSIPLIPAALGDPNSSVPHFRRDHAQHSPAGHLSPGADGKAKGDPALLTAFPCNATRLQLSISPQRGLQMHG